MLGKRLGPYTLLRRLGVGGVGAVYEASGPQRAAVKILHQPNTEMSARLRRELLAAQQINHPNAARCYESGQADGLFWLAMELIEGETLEQRLKIRGALSVQETLSLLTPLCALLHMAHQKGIVHRDLTTANIIIANEGQRPVLLDFGFASISGEAAITETGAVSGTAQYMSPEQWEGLKHTDAKGDIYSMGVILFECLSGKLPVEAKTPLEWLRKHTRGAPLDLADAMATPPPEAIRAAVMKSLSKKPEGRFSSMEELRQALLAAPCATEL
jgi:serine/threonine protein kinase